MATEFTHRYFKAAGKRVHRLGLALNYGIDANGVNAAFDRGINYLQYPSYRAGRTRTALRAALKKNREAYVLAAGPFFGFLKGDVTSGCDARLKELGVDYIDVFQLFWLGTKSAWTDSTVEALVKLKAAGKVRALGVSIHDRPRAGRLAEDSVLDMLMIRYNAAHPGAEREIFPHLEKRKPSIVAYTATSWKRLLHRPKGWEGKVMTAGDCYRFSLSSPHVDVVLTGPGSERELDENLTALEKGPLSAEESEWMRAYGKAVHG